jgi:hypothetical protein
MLFRVARRVNHKSIAQRGSPQGITSGRAKALYVAVRRHPSTVSPGVLLVGCKIKVKGGRQVSAPHGQNPRRFARPEGRLCFSKGWGGTGGEPAFPKWESGGTFLAYWDLPFVPVAWEGGEGPRTKWPGGRVFCWAGS